MKVPSRALLPAAGWPPRGVLLAIMVVAVALVALVGPGARPEAAPGRAWAQGADEATATCTNAEGTPGPLHGRTQQVVTAIVAKVANIDNCAAVTAEHLAALTGSLRLNNQALTALRGGDFAGLAGLTTLNLYENQLQTLPAGLFTGLTSLERLSLNSNRLSALPVGSFEGLTNLERLELRNNKQLTTVPAGLFTGLDSLEKLELQESRLSALPEDLFAGLDTLEELKLEQNRLETVPAGLFAGLTSLEKLELHSNPLTTVPAGLFAGLTSLTELRLENNRLRTLPASLFAGLTSLTALRLEGNRLRTLPASLFTGLTSLRFLHINNNRLCYLPANAFAGLTSLHTLVLSDNTLGNVRPAFFDYAAGSKLAALTELRLGDASRHATADELTQYRAALPMLATLKLAAGPIRTASSVCADPPPPPNGGSSSDTPSAPAAPPLFSASTGAATITEREDAPGQSSLVFQRHDGGASFSVPVGWISSDGRTVIATGFVRDEALGQTYAIVRRESDGQIVRLWVAPNSPLVYAINWPDILANYTVPLAVLVGVPLDGQHPAPNQLARRFDGGDDRIFSYDASLSQWRWVPDLGTFQALNFYWCDVTAADASFFARVTEGTPHPPTSRPAQADYPSCRP